MGTERIPDGHKLEQLKSQDEVRMERHELGKTKLMVTPLCWGGGPLSSMPEAFGYEVSEDQAQRTLLAAFESSVNFIDTANIYGNGRSELRIGEALRKRGGLPEGYIVATKADRDPTTNRFSAERMRKSVEESLERLGLSQLPLVYLHDPEKDPRYSSNRDLVVRELLAEGGPVAELEKLRDEGIIKHLGISGGPIDLLVELVKTGRFDAVITHNRWNLVFQTAEPLFIAAQEKNMGIINAAPFASGFLAGTDQSYFAYRTPSKEITNRVKQIKETCEKYGVPMKAAALQFSLREPRIHSTIVGVSNPEQVKENLDLLKIPIPEGLWVELKKLAITDGDPG